MNPLAVELNEILKGTVAERLLSRMGERMHFPKGIISQSAEADERAHRYNATIGMATEQGAPLILDSIKEGLPTLSPAQAVAYSSTGGSQALRKRWRAELDAKNPSLRGKRTSSPAVVPGLTAAISFTADLFIDEGDEVVVPDLYWPNYRLILDERKGASAVTFPAFAPSAGGGLGLNVAGLEKAMRESAARAKARTAQAKAICILNFPNNPTGYTPTLSEADEIVAALVRIASEGTAVLAIVDDAYFGLQYEEGLLRESIFARLADAHANILAVKADGPTKEDYVWGFRTGMLTFSTKADLSADALYGALEKKAAAAIRSAVSNCSHPAQSVLVKAMADADFTGECRQKRDILEARALKVQELLQKPEFAELWTPYPFNAGYFMCLKLKGIDADAYRRHLLEKHGVGVIADGKHDIRVAFSAVDLDNLPALYQALADAARELKGEAVSV